MVFLSRQLTKSFVNKYLGSEDAATNYLMGIQEVGVPRIFYCDWLPITNPQSRAVKRDIQKNYPNCCFNHRVGLPELKFENDDNDIDPDRIPLMGFNKRMLQTYHNHKRMSQNKCRGSGTSELITVRYMTFKYAVLNKIQNHKCIVCAGTRKATSVEFLTRMKPLLDAIPQVYETIPSTETPDNYRFKTGGRILAFPASPSAIRGQENVGDLALEECAHWNLINDNEVYKASEFVYTKTKCHITHPTTPNGMRGFYYDKVWDPEVDTEYFKHTINWREVTGLPVQKVEDLFDINFKTGQDVLDVRKECWKKYNTDKEYKKWFHEFFDVSFQEIVDVPHVILDINHITEQARLNPSEYDQELDNQFISDESRAIGKFAEEDFDPVDLRDQIAKFDLGDFA